MRSGEIEHDLGEAERVQCVGFCSQSRRFQIIYLQLFSLFYYRAMNNKITLLKEAIEKLRRSRETLKRQVRTIEHHQRHHADNTTTMHGDHTSGQIQKWQEMLRQKSMQMHSMQVTHADQIGKLTRKLQYKENVMKKLMQDQLKGLNLKGK